MLPRLRSSSGLVFVASGALIASGILQLLTAYVQYLAEQQRLEGSKPSTRQYTWLDDDFPNTLESVMGDPGKAALTLEDTWHFTLDGPHADAEWWSIYPGTSQGFVYLGPHRRFFGLSMYHQIHCLDALRFAIKRMGHAHRDVDERDASELYERSSYFSQREVDHTQHCLNYLRQTILCNADMTLEPEVVPGTHDVGEGLYATHVCKDWNKVHEWVAKNAADQDIFDRTRNKTVTKPYDKNTTDNHS